MRFLIDMNLPPEIGEWLRSKDHDAVHARDIGLSDWSDRDLFAAAAKDRRIVVTFDLDFGEIIGLTGSVGSGVVLLRLRAAQRDHLRERLRAVIAEAAGRPVTDLTAYDLYLRAAAMPSLVRK